MSLGPGCGRCRWAWTHVREPAMLLRTGLRARGQSRRAAAPAMTLATSTPAIDGVSYRHDRMHSGTYLDKVLKFNSPGRVEIHFLQSLSHDIIRLSLALLRALDCSSLVEVALVVDVELAKGILEAEDFVLLELRKLPAGADVSSATAGVGAASREGRGEGEAEILPLQLDNVHVGDLCSQKE